MHIISLIVTYTDIINFNNLNSEDFLDDLIFALAYTKTIVKYNP